MAERVSQPLIVPGSYQPQPKHFSIKGVILGAQVEGMVPPVSLLGISRQTEVLAFILGDGFSNLIIPTNGVLMAILGIAGVPFEKWFRFVLPLFCGYIAISVGFLMIAVMTGY